MRPGTQTVSGTFAGYKLSKGHYEVRHVPTGRVLFVLATWDQVLDQINRGDTELNRVFLAISVLNREPIEPCYPPPPIWQIWWEADWATYQVILLMSVSLVIGYCLGQLLGAR